MSCNARGRCSLAAIPLLLSGCCSDPAPGPEAGPRASNGIAVVAPNGGETFRVGGGIRIRWSSTNPDFTSARLRVACGTREWYDLASSSIDKPSGDTSLVVPDSVYSAVAKAKVVFPASADCKVQILDYVVGSIQDTSDASFTIQPR